MDNMLPIWLFLFWTAGAPLLWLLFDYLQTQRIKRIDNGGPMPPRAATPDSA